MDAMKTSHVFLLIMLALGGLPHAGAAECLIPSKPGGGMDLTCKLAQKALHDQPGAPELTLSYLPGGVGAVAWHSVVSQRRSEANTLVTLSGGSVLTLALGKFGTADVDDVRWVAAFGADYGMVAVRADSPYTTLSDLLGAIKRNPKQVLIGMSGTVGSQDWIKMAQGRTNLADLRGDTYWGGITRTIDAVTLTGAVYHINTKNLPSNLDADPTMFVARAMLALSKRTDLYLSLAHAKADNGQLIGLSRDDPGFGSTQSGITAGMQHRF